MIYLDTHVAVWLHSGDPSLFPPKTQAFLESGLLFISPAVLLELEYLHKTGRVTDSADTVLKSLQDSIGLEICDLPFHEVVIRAINEKWTRDPFDRLITAQAAIRNLPLVTKDRTIRKHYRQARWDRAAY